MMLHIIAALSSYEKVFTKQNIGCVNMKVVCSVCSITQEKSAVNRGTIPCDETVSHGYCKECGEKLLARIRRWAQAGAFRPSLQGSK